MLFIQKCHAMSKTLIRITCFFCVFFISPSLLAQEVPPPVFEKTLHDSAFTPQPRVSSSFDARLLASIEELAPNLGAEVTESFTIESTAASPALTDDEKDAAVLDTLLQVQSLEGIEYYSHRRKRYREFIIKSYAVDSVKDKNKVDDISTTSYKPEFLKESADATRDQVRVYKVLWFRQDSSFGSGVLEYAVFYNPQKSEFYVHMQNLQSIRYKNVLPLAQPKSMTLGVLIKREEDTYRAYAVAGVNAADMPFKSLRKRVGISLMYRLYATITWFEKALKEKHASVY